MDAFLLQAMETPDANLHRLKNGYDSAEFRNGRGRYLQPPSKSVLPCSDKAAAVARTEDSMRVK